RELVREQLLRLAWRKHADKPTTDLGLQPEFNTDLRGNSDFKTALDRMWPAMSGTGIVRSVLGNKRVLAQAAEGVLTADEQALLHRTPSKKVSEERWTRADLGLLDEAEALTVGTAVTYGHVVVDEAQDLTAMELRMLARRSPERSMTVLGDL